MKRCMILSASYIKESGSLAGHFCYVYEVVAAPGPNIVFHCFISSLPGYSLYQRCQGFCVHGCREIIRERSLKAEALVSAYDFLCRAEYLVLEFFKPFICLASGG